MSFWAIGAGVGGGDNSVEIAADCTFLGARSMNKAMSCLISFLKFPGLPATNTPIAQDFQYLYTVGPNAVGKADVKIPLRRGDRLYFYFSAEGAVICYFDDFIAEQEPRGTT